MKHPNLCFLGQSSVPKLPSNGLGISLLPGATGSGGRVLGSRGDYTEGFFYLGEAFLEGSELIYTLRPPLVSEELTLARTPTLKPGS